MNVDYNAYERFTVTGFTETVISRGRVIVDKGAYVGRVGEGRFVKRGPCGGQYANASAQLRRGPLALRPGLGSPGNR